MSSRFVNVWWCILCIIYIEYVSWSLSIRCGHDDVEYDIVRNDDIEPMSSHKHTHESHKLFNSLTSGQGMDAEKWLYKQQQQQTQHESDSLQTFSSRKNTKPHRHHASPFAFEHNQHVRHGPQDLLHGNFMFFDADTGDTIDHNVWKPFRIHYNAESLLSAWKHTEDATEFAENVIPAAMHYLERSLYVRPVKNKLRLSRPCVKYVFDSESKQKKCVQLKWNWQQCGSHVTIPDSDFEESEVCELDEHKENGVKSCKKMAGGAGHDADVTIYFSGDADFGCSDVYGYSAYCHTNKFDRPIAGFVNLCEDTLVQKSRIFTWEQKVTLVVHEVFHVLGFSSTGFAYFRFNDKHRTPRTPRESNDGHPKQKADGGYQYGSNTIQEHTVRGKNARFVTLPTVIKYAKKFFQCSNVIGIELEDFGGHDTAASHWEQRILGYEFMIGYIPPAAPFSVFSFAVLADSGWYKVNWKYASHHPYGREFGCDWIDKKCLSKDAKDMLDPLTFCLADIDYGCSKDHIAISNCQIEEYNFELPKYFQYFSTRNPEHKNVGGRLEYADYCPMYYHYNNGDCRFVDASIKHKRFGATITPQSKCVIVSHPEHHYENLKMQGLDGSAIVSKKPQAKGAADSTIVNKKTEAKGSKAAAAAAAAFAQDFDIDDDDDEDEDGDEDGDEFAAHHHNNRHRHHDRYSLHRHRRHHVPPELGVCYKQECFTDARYEWRGLRIEVWNRGYDDSEWLTCWSDDDDGRYKTTRLHDYDVRCPTNHDICYDKNPWLCNGHGMYDKQLTCVCNAGYIGCDCLYDDTAENRLKYPYSDHPKCQLFNVMKEGVFSQPPVGGGDTKAKAADDAADATLGNTKQKNGGGSALDILHDIIWDEIDVHFDRVSLLLLNVHMDLQTEDKYVTLKETTPKHREQSNLDFIQIAKTIKLLVAIPLKIDTRKIWISHYEIVSSAQHHKRDNLHNLRVTVTFENQQQLEHQEVGQEMTRILHKLFPRSVKMEMVNKQRENDDVDARMEYEDDLGISFGSELEHHSKASDMLHNSYSLVMIELVLYLFLSSLF